MTDRTFQQHALGLGTQQAEVQIEIDGAIIYNGTVESVDQPLPSLPDYDYDVENIAWSWQGDANSQGDLNYVITVNSGTVLMANTTANNPLQDANIYGRPDIESINEEVYVYPYVSHALINGLPKELNPYPWRQGQYWFTLIQGDVLTLTLKTIAATPPLPEVTESDPPESDPQLS